MWKSSQELFGKISASFLIMVLPLQLSAQTQDKWDVYHETRLRLEACATSTDYGTDDYACVGEAFRILRDLSEFEGRHLPALSYEVNCFLDSFKCCCMPEVVTDTFASDFIPLAAFNYDGNKAWMANFSDKMIWSGKLYTNGFVAGLNNEVLYFQHNDGRMSFYELSLPKTEQVFVDNQAPFRFRCRGIDRYILKRLADLAGWSIGGYPELPDLVGDWQADSAQDLVLQVFYDLDLPFVLVGDTLVFSETGSTDGASAQAARRRNSLEHWIGKTLTGRKHQMMLEPGLRVSAEFIAELSQIEPSVHSLNTLIAAQGWCADQVRGQYRLGSCFWIAGRRAEDVANARIRLQQHLSRRQDAFPSADNNLAALLDLLTKQPDALFLLNDVFEQAESVDQAALNKILNHLSLFQCDTAERDLLMPFRTNLDDFLSRSTP